MFDHQNSSWVVRKDISVPSRRSLLTDGNLKKAFESIDPYGSLHLKDNRDQTLSVTSKANGSTRTKSTTFSELLQLKQELRKNAAASRKIVHPETGLNSAGQIRTVSNFDKPGETNTESVNQFRTQAVETSNSPRHKSSYSNIDESHNLV